MKAPDATEGGFPPATTRKAFGCPSKSHQRPQASNRPPVEVGATEPNHTHFRHIEQHCHQQSMQGLWAT